MNHNEMLSLLYDGQEMTVRDALWKDIPMSQELFRVLQCRCVQKLSRIQQLGPASLLYPSAVHTRLDHSLGVYFLALSILRSLARKGCESLFTTQGVKSFLAAALLHDIGHFPYAHSLKELPLQSHEALAGELIMGERELNQAVLQAGAEPAMVASIIDDTLFSDDREVACYRKLRSGTLDPDKLDYLNRDAWFCGVPYGSQDAPFITSHMALSGGLPALEEKALGNVEHLLFGKYLMYRSVYWHPSTRSATAMIKKALLSALADGAIEGKQLYGLDDSQFFLLAERVGHPAFENIRQVHDGRLFQVAYERDWCETNPFDRDAASLGGRGRLERRIFERLSASYPALKPWQVVVDIPEPISFEADIPILLADGRRVPFLGRDQLFQSDISRVFTRCLRKTRLYLPAPVDSKNVRNLLE